MSLTPLTPESLAKIEVRAAEIRAENQSYEHSLLAELTARAALAVTEIGVENFVFEKSHTVETDSGQGSYPPEFEWSGRGCPRKLARIMATETVEKTTGGFAHDWTVTTSVPGVYIDLRGGLWLRFETGSGSYRNYPAHPGNSADDRTAKFTQVRAEDIEMDLREAIVEALRKITP